MFEQWASISDQENCAVDTGSSNIPDSRITLGPDLRFAKGVAIHYHMNPGDTSCFSGRSELAMGPKFAGETWPYMITRGHEGWYAFQVLFPSTYPLNSATVADGGVMQFHGYGGSGNVPFGISAGRLCHQGEGPGTPHPGGPELGYIKAWIKAASPEEKSYCLSEEVHANTVYDILIHARFAEDPSGFVEVFFDGARVMDFTGSFGFVPSANSILRSGLYPDTSRSESPAIDLYEGGWTLASTREAAEAGAF
ncbi:MAG TPA: heparin lyase I family protein [Solirubrobacteraceae bacterium]|nr:heparin lyase I family protein [Solirubrobacteraceae bacterium]